MRLIQGNRIKLGELLINEGIITEQQLDHALAVQKNQDRYAPLGEVCSELGYISRTALRNILTTYQKQILLGDLLVNMGVITEDQLHEALAAQRGTAKKLGEILIEKHFIRQSALAEALSVQLGIPKITPNIRLVDTSLSNGINPAFFQKKKAIPIYDDKERGVITVIMDDPLDTETVSSLEKMFGKQVEPAISTTGKVEDLVNEILNSAVKLGTEKRRMDAELVLINNTLPTSVAQDDNTAIFDFIVSEAVKKHASDIHIEPMEKKIRVRYRIDGILQHETDLPRSIGTGLSTRIKAICGLDIAERRRHQDGRIEAKIREKEVDLRVSTYAAMWGENIVIRLLNRQTSLVDINQIGFSPFNLDRYQRLLRYPAGVILVTGPTGSGKTTTLYASLMYLNNMDKKIITVEDPVEYTIDGVIQAKLDPKMDLTYADFIKSMMRQDPDIIMIGEIRDETSAAAAIQCALTGHKVFSSFHTDDTTGALLRLMDMGTETFLISSTVVSVVAQRLVRTLCPHCKTPVRPEPAILDVFSSIVGNGIEEIRFFGPRGCPKCNESGYKGRLGVQEVLEINDDVRDAILTRKPSGHIRRIARETGQLISMAEDGFYKAAKGVTSLEEVLRICFINKGDAAVPYDCGRLMELCDHPEGRGRPVLSLAGEAQVYGS